MAPERRQFGKYLLADVRDAVERPGAVAGLVGSVLGAVLLVVGLAAAVLVGPSSTYSASRTLQPGGPAVVLTSGVVGAVGPEVTVTAHRLDDGSLFLGRALSQDVTDLTGGSPSVVVRGVHALHGLVTAKHAGTASLPTVQGSDIWRDSSVGGGTRSLAWRPGAERQSVLIASTDGTTLPAVKVTVSWHRSGWFPVAVLLVLLGLGLLVAGLHRLTGGGHLLRRSVRRVSRRMARIPVPARRLGRRPDDAPVSDGPPVSDGTRVSGRGRISGARALVGAGLVVALLSGCSAAGGLVGVHPSGGSTAAGPALEPQQARSIVGRILTVANQADAVRSSSTAGQAYDGLALQMMTAAYGVDTAQGTTVPRRPTSSERPMVLLTRGTAYPRFFFTVLPGNHTQPPLVSLLTTKDASSQYRIAGSVSLLPSARIPAVAEVTQGSTVLPADTHGLALSPGAVATAYAAVLNGGSSVPEAGHFRADSFLSQVQQAASAQRATVARFGSYTQSHQPVPGGTLAIRTSDGGALVFTTLLRTSTFTARAGNVATLPPDVRVLTGEVQASSFSSTAAEMLLFSVPPAGKGKVALVGASDGLISATAH